MTRGLLLASTLIAASALTAGCAFEQRTNVASPSSSSSSGGSETGAPAPGTTDAHVGFWAADGVDIPTPSSCTNFKLEITSESSNSLSGDFEATCADGLTIEGTASGSINGNSVPLSLTGTVTLGTGLLPCNFSLSGTGTIDGDTLTIPYSGTTCLGPVRGTQVLRRHRNPPPPAPTPPTPAPAPNAPDPLLGCGDLAGGPKVELVRCIHDRLNAPNTVEGAFEVTKRVAWALRGEGAGLLIKNVGENIVPWQGMSFSAGRVCYPDGHIFKDLSDIPATNGPMWLENGFVDPSFYVPAIDPLR
jgi:hypothetical protein